MPPPPNISVLKMKEVMGQFVTPQNKAINPKLAEKEAGRPNSGPMIAPKVAPTKKEGTISPPLNPAPKVSAVKIIFKRKAKGKTWPFSAFSMIGMPAPK